MAHITINQGLDIPMKGKPEGEVQSLPKPIKVALNLEPFFGTKFKLLAKAGNLVKAGDPLVFDKMNPKRVFVSPAGGIIKEIRRGVKRRLLNIVIELGKEEEFRQFPTMNPATAKREDLLERLLEGGVFAHIRQRPFNTLANPSMTPDAIFVKAIESAPLCCSAEMQVDGHEEEFQAGLTALTKLTEGKVHLVYREGSSCRTFADAKGVEKHTISGPHPAGNVSVHIHHIRPIQSYDEKIWTLTVVDVIAIGTLLTRGRVQTEKVVAISGTGIVPGKRGFFRARFGHMIGDLIAGRNEGGLIRLISGDALMGNKVEVDDFLGFYDTCFTALPENTKREMLHFFRMGGNKFTATRAYASGHLNHEHHDYEFTTNQHGEHRGLIDAAVFDQVMPMQVPAMLLVKSVLSQDFDTAEMMGLLEVDAEDFALPTFIDPSKTEMVDIIRNGLRQYSAEVLQ
jgi:Na+-transporting NADH:ubiquinone oxidoreductase subunit A